jgi:hypothetical protein
MFSFFSYMTSSFYILSFPPLIFVYLSSSLHLINIFNTYILLQTVHLPLLWDIHIMPLFILYLRGQIVFLDIESKLDIEIEFNPMQGRISLGAQRCHALHNSKEYFFTQKIIVYYSNILSYMFPFLVSLSHSSHITLSLSVVTHSPLTITQITASRLPLSVSLNHISSLSGLPPPPLSLWGISSHSGVPSHSSISQVYLQFLDSLVTVVISSYDCFKLI